MGGAGERLVSWEGKVIGGLGAVCVGLAMLWLTNMWNAIEAERLARAEMSTMLASTFVTKDTINLITAARERQIEAIVQRIERNTDRIIQGEERMVKILEDLSRIRAEISAISHKIGGGR
jgi:septal ring factor EnvC (AmiA/AmiB activator)